MTEVDSLESRSVMSIDSIEPKENSDVWRKSRVNTHHSPIKNLISQWTSNPAAAHKSPAFDGSENEGKDYLSVSSNPHRPQTPPAVRNRLRRREIQLFVWCVVEPSDRLDGGRVDESSAELLFEPRRIRHVRSEHFHHPIDPQSGIVRSTFRTSTDQHLFHQSALDRLSNQRIADEITDGDRLLFRTDFHHQRPFDQSLHVRQRFEFTLRFRHARLQTFRRSVVFLSFSFLRSMRPNRILDAERALKFSFLITQRLGETIRNGSIRETFFFVRETQFCRAGEHRRHHRPNILRQSIVQPRRIFFVQRVLLGCAGTSPSLRIHGHRTQSEHGQFDDRRRRKKTLRLVRQRV